MVCPADWRIRLLPKPVGPTRIMFSRRRTKSHVTNCSMVQSLGVELRIKTLQRRQLTELRGANPPLQCPLPSGFSRLGQLAMQELQMAQRFPLRRLHRRIERIGGQGDA